MSAAVRGTAAKGAAAESPAHVVVPCKCGCGRDVPETRDLYASNACNARMQGRRAKRRHGRQLIVGRKLALRVRALAAALDLTPREVLTELLSEALAQHEAPRPDAKAGPLPGGVHFSVRDVIHVVSEETGIAEESIIGRERTSDVCLARHLVAWLAARLGHSLAATARQLGRDHTTIMHSLGAGAVRLGDPAVVVTADRCARRLGLQSACA